MDRVSFHLVLKIYIIYVLLYDDVTFAQVVTSGGNVCDSEPCLHGGLCIPVADGTFACDCPREFLGPNCTDLIDQCVINVCQHGSTCVARGDDEYECMCQIPFKGEHCEEEDLCLIDVDECVDNLMSGPKCYPCLSNQTCNKVGPEKYSCKNFEDTKLEPRALVIRQVDDGFPPENILIPLIVICCLLAYLIFLFVALVSDYISRKRPRLILMGDLQRLTLDTFYLLTIETGYDPFAGTNVRVYCIITGDLDRTEVLVLNNYLLECLQQNDEVDFLISTPRPLGNILSVQIWLDPEAARHSCCTFRPFWYCRNIMLRDIKTEQIWYFFVCKWLSFRAGHSAFEIPVATHAEVAAFYATRCSWTEYWRQVREHHLWLQIFTAPPNSLHTHAERITTASALFFCYMIVTMLFYGINEDENDHEMKRHNRELIDDDYYPMFSIGTKTGLIGILIGYVLAISFRFIRRQRIPALIVWDSGEGPNTKRNVQLQTEPIEFGKTEAVNPDSEPFRIPSTDALTTDDWIYHIPVDPEPLVNTIWEKRPYPDKFVHHYHDGRRRRSHVLKRLNRQSHLNVRQSEETANLSVITEVLADPIPEPVVIFQKNRREKLAHLKTKLLHPAPPSEQRRVSFEDEVPNFSNQVDESPLLQQERIGDSGIPVGSETQLQVLKNTLSSTSTSAAEQILIPIKLELCNIEHVLERHHCLPYWFLWISWTLCLSLIFGLAIVLIYYGYRFSWHKSLNWVCSLLWALGESIFIFQPLKALLAYLIVLYKRRIKDHKNPDEFDAKLRFKLLWVSGEILPLLIWPLYYLIHPLRYNSTHQLHPEDYPFPLTLTPQQVPYPHTTTIGQPGPLFVPAPQYQNQNLAPTASEIPQKSIGKAKWLSDTGKRVSLVLQEPAVKALRSFKSFHSSRKSFMAPEDLAEDKI